MTPEAAAEVFAHLRDADRALHAAYCLLGEAGAAGQFQVYQHRLACLLSITFIGVTRPLYEHYPELMPDDVKEIPVLPPDAQQAVFEGRSPS